MPAVWAERHLRFINATEDGILAEVAELLSLVGHAPSLCLEGFLDLDAEEAELKQDRDGVSDAIAWGLTVLGKRIARQRVPLPSGAGLLLNSFAVYVSGTPEVFP